MKKLDLIEDRWLSIKEIAEYLGVRRETIYVYLEKKNLPGHRIGKFWKFQKEDVDNWVKSGKAAEDNASDNFEKIEANATGSI